jgi:catechol 2,3-dioxygenase-like lactoylglutathione lyase family enzyme
MFLEHVNMTVADVEKSAEFYCKLLDLKLRWRGTTSDGRPAAHVGNDRSYFAFFGATKPGKSKSDYHVAGLNHFGLTVDNLEATKDRLVELGVTPHSEQDYDPGKRLYFFDPDGIEVELVEYDS